MQIPHDGNVVSVHYTATLDSGEVFDTSQGRQPLEFEIGKGNMIQGFENAVRGMQLNESKTVTLPPAEAYGERDDSLLRTFARNTLPAEMSPEIGQSVTLQSNQGQKMPARISHVDDEKVVVDMNHPLAGQALTFEIHLVAINDKAGQTDS
jgi:peptidylprolyl isomerase